MTNISIIVPLLGRPLGLERLMRSVKALNLPEDVTVETIAIQDEPRMGVPIRLKQGVQVSAGEYIVYAANDMEFTPDCLMNALRTAEQGYDLIAFNTGEIYPDEGNICEHFMIKRSFIPKIGGEIFDTEMQHAGVDNLLWAKAKKFGKAISCRDAHVIHHHFTKGEAFDEVYQLAYSTVEQDRALLKQKLIDLDAIP